MLGARDLVGQLDHSPLAAERDALLAAIAEVYQVRRHGHLDLWEFLLRSLPDIIASDHDFRDGLVRVGHAGDTSPEVRQSVRETLEALRPWRKGPFEVLGIGIDAEWRSDIKWSRLQDRIEPLPGRLVLDVGCGNGYYIFRMLGAGARYVMGIDPSQLFMAQFYSIRHFLPGTAASVLPLRLEEFPTGSSGSCEVRFDTTFSMGVLYHRRCPRSHLEALGRTLGAGGELVLETLVIEGGAEDMLIPDGPYARMPNVRHIPSVPMVRVWLEDCGYGDIRCLDVSRTTAHEQRKTAWMQFESLEDFLDPADPGRTIEGFPAPMRAVFSARKRG